MSSKSIVNFRLSCSSWAFHSVSLVSWDMLLHANYSFNTCGWQIFTAKYKQKKLINNIIEGKGRNTLHQITVTTTAQWIRGGISRRYRVTYKALIGRCCFAGYRVGPLKTSPFPQQKRLNPESHSRWLRISHQRLQRWSRSLLGRGRWFPARTLTTTWKQLVGGDALLTTLPVANCEFTATYANFKKKIHLTHWFYIG